jgi:hypothetical protein
LASARARVGPDLDDLVGDLHHGGVVLDDEDGVALVPQLPQQGGHGGDVVRVETDGGLVEDVEHLDETAAEVLHRLDPLRLPAGQAGGGAAEMQVPEPDGDHGPQPLGEGGHDRRDGGVGHLLHDADEFGDLHTGHLADGAPQHGGGAGRLVETVPVALGTGVGASEPVDDLPLAVGEVVPGAQVDPFEPLDDALVVLRWPGAQTGGVLAAVQQGLSLGLRPVTQRGVHVEAADAGVLVVPVAALTEPGQQDRALGQGQVQVEEPVHGAHHHLADPGAGRAHTCRVVEREAVRLAHVR